MTGKGCRSSACAEGWASGRIYQSLAKSARPRPGAFVVSPPVGADRPRIAFPDPDRYPGHGDYAEESGAVRRINLGIPRTPAAAYRPRQDGSPATRFPLANDGL